MTLALRTREYLKQAAEEIWADAHEVDGDEEDDVDGDEPEVVALRSVSGAVAELRESVVEMSEAHRGLSGDQRSLFEGMAGVLGEVAAVSIKAQEDAATTVKAGQDHLSEKVAEMMQTVGSDSKKLQSSLVRLDQAVEKLSSRLDDIVAALTAPRTLVTDKDGRPVGVKIGR